MIKIISIGSAVLFLGFSTFFLWPQTSSCEGDVYKQLVAVGGIVTTTEIESNDETRVRGKTIIFKRTDCKKCISAVQSGDEGIYEIYLSEGKYQLIVNECGPEKTKDCLSPNQPRFINVSRNDNPQFDIKLVHSKTDNEITLPKGLVVPTPAQ
ncbi:MAG: hypothetical protein KIT41_11285 [Pyrinomonadaceae bacterium]|nr:hypothetical protein [Pyrinomonadaceae bacterium]